MGGIVRTNTGFRGTTLPRLEGENPDVFPGSPLAVIGLWVFALRKRFNANIAEPLPWVWEEELRPYENQDANPLPEGSPRKLLIESMYNVEKSNRNYRPAIYVGRGGNPVRANKIMVDNKVGVRHKDQFKAYLCHASMPIIIECESESSGESSSIAETVWAFILTTRDIFRKDFGFNELTEPVLGDTQPSKTDKEVWITNVQFEVTFDMRWGVTPIAPILREIALELSAGFPDADRFFTEITLKG